MLSPELSIRQLYPYPVAEHYLLRFVIDDGYRGARHPGQCPGMQKLCAVKWHDLQPHARGLRCQHAAEQVEIAEMHKPQVCINVCDGC
eukprot:scaffold249020_cov28-Tisochrysis_lutea.AAC.4